MNPYAWAILSLGVFALFWAPLLRLDFRYVVGTVLGGVMSLLAHWINS